MMTEIPIIAVKSQYDQVLAFFNNAAPKAMHFKNDRLHEYVKGNASQFTFKTAAKHSDSQYLVEGNKLAFRWKNKDYDLNIVKVIRDEKVVEVTAYSTMFELLYETRGEYTGNSMTFEQYLNVFDPEHVLVVGVNEVSSARISNKWEGTQTILARLFSLATVFSAELEFVTELNDDYTLKQVTLNVYKEYSDGLNQGIGQNRSDVILKYGKGITGITKTSDISDGIYTAILAYGKDGLSINDIERNWYNEDGNLEYFTRKGQPRIYAPLARDNFPSNLFASENERYIGYEADDTEYTSQEALLGYMLSELKKLSAPEVTYEIDGKFDVDVGDTIIVEDDGYNPTLYLSVRVAETEKSLSNPSIRKAVISNVKELSSEIDASLLAQVQALIEANKTYTFEILTSSGIVFKNGFGSTTLTARVRDGIKDVTDTFSLKWYKDGTLFSNTKTVTINAADIEEKAVFRFEVADDSGNVRGGAEVTVTNVDDGKKGEPGETYYPHRGYLMADGTFTKVYPNENLLNGSSNWTELDMPSSSYFTQFGTEVEMVPGKTYTFSIEVKKLVEDGVPINLHIGLGENKNYTWDFPSWRQNNIPMNSRVVLTYTIKTTDIVNQRKYFAWRLRNELKATKIAYRIVKLEESDTATIFTTPPSIDFANAYPKYEGFYSDTNQIGSDNPDDYKPWTPFMGPQGGQGPKGDSAPLISLSGATQAITVDKDGKITPASSFAVNGTEVNTAISNWTYSLNGGNFGSAVPTGVTRLGNIVTIDPTKAVFDTLTIKAADATVSDVFTISRIKDGGEGPPGSDAYTVFLTNESYTFAGSTTAALAGSTTTEVIVYKGINKITPTSITVGTKPTGLSSSVSGSIITLTATTALVSKSGTVPITIIADGKTFTKQFSYALSLQGGKGDPGDPGKGVSAEEISYTISQDGVNPPTSGWSGTRPTPKAGWYMWTRTRFKYTDNTYSAYFYLVAQQGKDAIIISATPPTNPSKEDLWQDPNDATSTVYKWDGTQWIRWGISIDNLIVSNVQIENGVFKRVEGALIVGSEFRNPYTVTYNDGSVSTGTVVMEGSAITNSGVNKTSSGVRRYAYEDAWSPGNLTMSRYDDDKVGDQNKLLAALGLTYNRLTLTDLQTGFAGSLTAEMLFDTGYVSLPVLKGSGAIRVRRYMGRYMIWFDTFIWNGSGGGGIGDAVIQLPAEFNPGRQQMLEVPIWSTAPGRADRFQLNTDGRLYKLSNNSGGTYFRTFTEIF